MKEDWQRIAAHRSGCRHKFSRKILVLSLVFQFSLLFFNMFDDALNSNVSFAEQSGGPEYPCQDAALLFRSEHHVFGNGIGMEVNSSCADMKMSGASLFVLIIHLHEHAERKLRLFIFLSLYFQSSHEALSRV